MEADMTLTQEITATCRKAREASRRLAMATRQAKDSALQRAAAALRAATNRLLEANRADSEAASREGASATFLDRLTLSPERIEAMAAGLEHIASLSDPVGELIRSWKRPNGLTISQVRIPIGVVAVIYESRPNVTADAAALCLKSGNAALLRGGREAFATNSLIASLIAEAALSEGMPAASVQLIPTQDRAAVKVMLRQRQYIDVVIPRGGEALIKTVTEESSIPVIQHFSGICTTYIDGAANLDMAEAICVNAKVQRPGVCNAMENLLINQSIAPQFTSRIINKLRSLGVEVRGCPKVRALVPEVAPAGEEDWGTEYLDLMLSVKLVESLDEAISFISTYSSGLAECIVTEDPEAAGRFTREVDSAAVFINASTRFTDGFEFGFGAEVGISTNRLHARGPMGLAELTTYKYIVRGNGQVRE